jgi:hypothetical protein
VSAGNHLDTVIEAGDILDGRTVAAVQMGFDALEGQSTLHTGDLLPKFSQVAPLCRDTKIVMPSELAAELSAS